MNALRGVGSFQSVSCSVHRSVQHIQRQLITYVAIRKPAWTQSEQDKLIRIINAKYRDKVAGNWELVVQHIKDIPVNYRHPWTQKEHNDLALHIKTHYYQAGRRLNWTKIGRAFGRTALSCKLAYYMRRSDGPETGSKDSSAASLGSKGETAAVEQVLKHGSHSDMIGKVRQAIEQNTSISKTDGLTQIDWEGVAAQISCSLATTLALVDAIQRTARQPQLIELSSAKYPEGWTGEMAERLAGFIAKHCNEDSINWLLVSHYMGICTADCIEAYQSTKRAQAGLVEYRKKWQPEEIRRLREAMANPHISQTWSSVARHVGGSRSASACSSFWQRLQVQKDQKDNAWTDGEIEQLERAIKSSKHGEHILSQLVLRFPNKTCAQVRAQLHKAKHRLRPRSVPKWTPMRVRQLQEYAKECSASGQVDWLQVADRLGGNVLPSSCEKKHKAVVAMSGGVQKWTAEEVGRLKDAVRKLHAAGALRWSAVANMVGTKSEIQCYNRAYRLKDGELVGAFR